MRYDLLKPCRECPYTGQTPGWIGGHESPQEFIDIAMTETRLPCHMTTNDEEGFHPDSPKAQACAAFRASLCKLPRDRDLADHQRRVVAAGQAVVLSPAELLEVHSRP